MKKKLLTLVSGITYLPILMLVLCWVSSEAATSTFSERIQFLSATAELEEVPQAISFDSLVWAPSNSFRDLGPTLALSGVTFSGRYLLADNWRETTRAGTVLFNFDSEIPLSLKFDQPIRAFGADFGSGSAPFVGSFTATLTLDTGQVFTFKSPTNPDSTFFGFIVINRLGA